MNLYPFLGNVHMPSILGADFVDFHLAVFPFSCKFLCYWEVSILSVS